MFGSSDRAAPGWAQGWAVPGLTLPLGAGEAPSGAVVSVRWLPQAVNPWPDHRA